MGYKSWATGNVLTASDLDNYLMNQVIIACTSGSRPSSPQAGMTIYETDTKRTYQYDGTGWVLKLDPGLTVAAGGGIASPNYPGMQSYTPTWAGLTLGNGTTLGRYIQLDTNVVLFFAQVRGGSTTSGTAGSVSLPVNLPTSPTPIALNGTWHHWGQNNLNYGGVLYGYQPYTSNGVAYFREITSASNNADAQALPLDASNIIVCSGIYMLA